MTDNPLPQEDAVNQYNQEEEENEEPEDGQFEHPVDQDEPIDEDKLKLSNKAQLLKICNRYNRLLKAGQQDKEKEDNTNKPKAADPPPKKRIRRTASFSQLINLSDVETGSPPPSPDPPQVLTSTPVQGSSGSRPHLPSGTTRHNTSGLDRIEKVLSTSTIRRNLLSTNNCPNVNTPPTTPSWTNMINENQRMLEQQIKHARETRVTYADLNSLLQETQDRLAQNARQHAENVMETMEQNVEKMIKNNGDWMGRVEESTDAMAELQDKLAEHIMKREIKNVQGLDKLSSAMSSAAQQFTQSQLKVVTSLDKCMKDLEARAVQSAERAARSTEALEKCMQALETRAIETSQSAARSSQSLLKCMQLLETRAAKTAESTAQSSEGVQDSIKKCKCTKKIQKIISLISKINATS